MNADSRTYRGLTPFTVRGLNKIKCVTLWCALAYNLMHFSKALPELNPAAQQMQNKTGQNGADLTRHNKQNPFDFAPRPDGRFAVRPLKTCLDPFSSKKLN